MINDKNRRKRVKMVARYKEKTTNKYDYEFKSNFAEQMTKKNLKYYNKDSNFLK